MLKKRKLETVFSGIKIFLNFVFFDIFFNSNTLGSGFIRFYIFKKSLKLKENRFSRSCFSVKEKKIRNLFSGIKNFINFIFFKIFLNSNTLGSGLIRLYIFKKSLKLKDFVTGCIGNRFSRACFSVKKNIGNSFFRACFCVKEKMQKEGNGSWVAV